jgi:bifunctional oligoribonuclease and PAP phosphatase NrnA
MVDRIQWAEATQAVANAETILLVTHVSPDGDAIGSMLGLANALRERGKNVETTVSGGVPDYLQFIAGADSVKGTLDSGDWSLMISLDASDEERTGLVGIYGRAHSPKVINLDHHATNTMFGSIFLVNSAAVSAAEIVFDWLAYLHHPLSPEVATALLTGLVTDTRGFRTSNCTARTLQIAQQLMEAGASLADVTARTLDSKSYTMVELWKSALHSVELKKGLISATITQADLKRVGLTDVTDGGLVSLLIGVNEAKVAVVFKELAHGEVELSFRSKPGYDVAQVALALGGGGHKQASGATIPGPLIAARERVLPMLRVAVEQGSPLVV